MEAGRNFGLAAMGRSGGFTLEVLRRPEGGWLLSVDAPGWCCDLDLAGPAAVADLARFLRTHAGRAEFAELMIGALSGMPVRVVKDDESSDRLSIRATGGGSLVEFTLMGDSAKDFIEAVEQASAEFEG